MMVDRYGCEPCENYVDALKKDGEFLCADCGDPMDFVGKVGCVRGLSEGQTPNNRLAELVEDWKEGQGTDGRTAEVFEICAEDLEEAIIDGE